MHSQLRERIRLMRARLDNAAPVAEIRAESQLFVTPAPVCDRLVTLAEISNVITFWNPLPAPGPYCGRFGIPRRRPCVMRWRLTAGWSGICGKILTVSGYSVATSWNGSRCSITAGSL